MIQNEEDNADWDQTLSSPSDIDHTLAGRCRGTDQNFNAEVLESWNKLVLILEKQEKHSNYFSHVCSYLCSVRDKCLNAERIAVL